MPQDLQSLSASTAVEAAIARPAPPHAAHELWMCFLRHRFLAAGISLTLMAGIVAALWIVPPRYRATAMIMIEARTPQVVKTDAVLSRLPSDFDSVASELEVLLSRDMAAELVARLRLDRSIEFDPNRSLVKELFASWLPQDTVAFLSKLIDHPSLYGQQRIDAIVDAVRQHLDVAPIGRSRVISITFSSHDPETAGAVANTLAEMYVARQTETKEDATRQANAWIKDRLPELREKAQQAAREVEQFRSESGLIQARDTSLIRQQLSDLSTLLTAATAARIDAAAKLQNVQRAAASRGNASSDVLGSRLIQDLRAQEAEIASKYSNVRATMGERNPEVVAMKASMDDIDRRIQAEIHRIVASVEGDYQAALARESSLQRQMDDAKARIAALSSSEVRLGELEQEAKADQNLYDSFLQRYKETGLEHTFETPDARVISHAVVPLKPYFPNRVVLLPIGAVMSVLAAAVVLILLDLRDRGIRSREQIERLLGIPAVGLVPEVHRRERRESGVPDPLSLLGSAVTDLYMRMLAGESPKCVVVASALPAEGKTTLSLCVARIASANGKKVLLIDGDLRRSGLTERLSNVRGLSDVVDGTVALEDAAESDPAAATLTVLGSGTRVGNPAGLLSSAAVRRFFAEARQKFDLIIIDSPALMAGPDAWILAQMADQTLYVVRWARTPRHVASAGLRLLRDAGARVSGCVLTLVNLKRIGEYSQTDAVNYSQAIRRYYARRAA